MSEEAKIPEEAPAPTTKFEWLERKENTPEIYGNFLHISWTLFDVRFQIGQLIPQGANLDSGFKVEPRGAVTVAWSEAKILRDSLNGILAKYEEANGELKQIKIAQRP